MKLKVGDDFQLEGWRGILRILFFEENSRGEKVRVAFTDGDRSWIYPISYLEKNLFHKPLTFDRIPYSPTEEGSRFLDGEMKFREREEGLDLREKKLSEAEDYLRSCQDRLIELENHWEERINKLIFSEGGIVNPNPLSIRDQMLLKLNSDNKPNVLEKNDFDVILTEKKELTVLETNLLATLIERMGWGI